MDEKIQRKIFQFFNKNKIENFVGVPDSTLKHFIDEGLKCKKILIANREEEAIGIGAGMILADSSTIMFMQNAGFANSISTIASLVDLYEIPMIFLIGWRGYLKSDAPEHLKIGRIQNKLFQALELKTKILTDENWKNVCEWAIKKKGKNESCAIIVRRLKDE